MNTLMLIIFAHYLGDYPLQGDFLGTQKSNYNYLLFVHCLIWTGTICLALHFTDHYDLWKIPFLFIGHYAIDYWKCRKKNKKNALTWDLWIDQSLHFCQCLIVWAF